MNKLQIVQRAHQEIFGGHNGTAYPTALTGLTGEDLRLVNWTEQAWVELQEAQEDWRWMFKTATLDTVAGTREYSLSSITDLDEIKPYVAADYNPYIHIYKTSDGAATTRKLYFTQYPEFGGFFDSANQTSQGPPALYSIKPDGKITLSPIPDAVYTITIPYRKTLQTFTSDSTAPDLPSKFHMLIVYGVMRKYGRANESNRAFEQADEEYRRMYQRLCMEQKPFPTVYGA